jgi:hypothetical protein
MTTAIQDAVTKLVTDVAALEVLVGAMVPPVLPPPPIVGTVSPNGTVMSGPGVGQSIIGSGPHTFTFGGPFHDKGPEIWGYDILRDGAEYGPLNAMWMTIKTGVVYALTITNIWYVDTGSGWIPGAPFPAVVSPDGTTIVPGDGGYLLDAGLHLFTFGPLASNQNDYWILRDGPQYASGAAVKMTVHGGVIYALTKAGQWYKNANNGWSISAAPV